MPNIDEQEEFLRKKIAESTVDYSDHYWQDARQMLGTKRRRKFGWWWLPVFVLLPVIASVSYFAMKDINGSKPKASITSTSAKHDIASSDALVLSTEKNKSTVSEQAHSASPDNLASVTHKIQTNNTPESISDANKKEAEKTQAQKIARSSPPINNKPTPKKGTSHRAISVNDNRNITSSSANAAGTGKQNDPSGVSASESETSNATNNNRAKENVSSANNSSVTQSTNGTDNYTTKEATPTTEAAKAVIASSLDTSKQIADNNQATSAIPAATNKVDTASGKTASKKNFRNKILAISLGCNFNRGINATGVNNFAVGALPYLGVSYAIPITTNNKVTLRGGLILNMYNRLRSETEVHHSNYYSFGYGETIDKNTGQVIPVTDTVFSLHQQLLFTLQLPVVLNYYISGKSSISIGAGVAYTLGVYSKVINFNGTETSSFGYPQGYKPFNLFLQAGYCYNLTKNWAIELTIQQGLTDMTDDAFFNSSRKDRFSNLQVGLKHEFAIKPKKSANEKN